MKCSIIAASRIMAHYRLNCSLFHRFDIFNLKSKTYNFGTKLEQPFLEVHRHHHIEQDIMCISFCVKAFLCPKSMINFYRW